MISTTELEQAYGTQEITTSAMRDAITDWFTLYEQQEATDQEDPCQRIPYVIVNKITKAVLAEYKPECKKDFGAAILQALDKVSQEAIQMALIGGEALIKPIPTKEGFRFSVIARDAICVFARNAEGYMTDIGTCEMTTRGSSYYTLLERRTLSADGHLTISNMLYKSFNSGSLGSRVSLSELDQYAELVDEYTYSHPMTNMGLIPVKTPQVNCVDRSKDAVSVYAPAVGLIHNINVNEAQLNGEFKRGESRILASSDYFSKKNGTKSFDSHLFIKLEGDPEETGGITIFSPSLRDASFLNRKKEYLRNVETVCGLKRGLLSEVESADRTAKEISSSEGDYSLTIIDFQNMWENAVREVLITCSVVGKIYKVSGTTDLVSDDLTIDWGNGVLYDEDKTWADYLNMVSSGLIKPEIALGWRFNMPTETPADLQKIREKYMPDMDGLMGGAV